MVSAIDRCHEMCFEAMAYLRKESTALDSTIIPQSYLDGICGRSEGQCDQCLVETNHVAMLSLVYIQLPIRQKVALVALYSRFL